jgi:hypothetical protein
MCGMTFQHDTTGRGHDLMGGLRHREGSGDGYTLASIIQKYDGQVAARPARRHHPIRNITILIAVLLCVGLLFLAGCSKAPDSGTVTGKRIATIKVCVKYTGAGPKRKCVKSDQRDQYVITLKDGDKSGDKVVDGETFSELNVGDHYGR